MAKGWIRAHIEVTYLQSLAVPKIVWTGINGERRDDGMIYNELETDHGWNDDYDDKSEKGSHNCRVE